MDDFFTFDKHGDDGDKYSDAIGLRNARDKKIQIELSLALGLISFFAFCVLRPRWAGLYAARKKHKHEATVLPELPATAFGWIMPLWRIGDQQILASAGLDAYAFLTFFKMAMKFLLVTLFFSLIVIKPVHDANPDDDARNPKNGTHHHKHKNGTNGDLFATQPMSMPYNGTMPWPEDFESDYLWMYVVFAYLFSTIAIYLIVTETKKVIEVRQEYLGTQTSITDRTIRLSGIPEDLRDEGKLQEFIESLDIGKVESVTVCRNWKELDAAVVARMDALRKLEEAYTINLGQRRVERNLESLPVSQPAPPSPAARDLLGDDDEADEATGLVEANAQSHPAPYERQRPKTSIRYGFMKLRSTQVDAIDYYEEKFRSADELVRRLRKKSFDPVPLAYVTMDSVAACQMAIQAVLGPSPLQLIASQSPAPADVIWPNTYLPRRSRMVRAWSITIVIVLLTIFWSALFVPIAGLLNTKTIGKIFPQLAEVLDDHANIRSLVNTQLPTLILTLLMVLVPYLYYWMSWYQGMTSQGDVELSAISKNFFFTFFNFFIVFTLLGTASQFYLFFKQFGDALKSFNAIANGLAYSLQKLLNFYVNFIILQGLGLFPFRLLEVGAVTLYPVYRIGAKTPRDYAELVQPPVFSYGFYLPTALLIFIICMVYSVLRSSWQVLLAGLIYFTFGHFVYKYQLLYAMDHQQQATGRAWVMICDRVFVGLIFFQLTTAGQLLLKSAAARSLLIVPLIIVTIWINILYGRTYKPLMKFIALRSVQRGQQYSDYASPPPEPNSAAEARSTTSSTDLAPERDAWAETTSGAHLRYFRETRVGVAKPAVDESDETGLRFMNPSLIAPLDGLWIADKEFRREEGRIGMDAAIIEGRVGIYLDLLATSSTPSESAWETAGAVTNEASSSSAVIDFGSSDEAASSPTRGRRDVTVGDFDELSVNAGSMGESNILHQCIEVVTQRSWAHYYHGRRARLRGMRHTPAVMNGVWPRALTISGGEKNKEQLSYSQLVYRNVCMDEDPPTSIAISPTRQCVAFGCKSGVELYWIDSTTGQNLNRWFPLTRPSDHLYFLPPRQNIDTRLRLRLISSATKSPDDHNTAVTTRSPHRNSWFSLSSSWHVPATLPRSEIPHTADHAYAVPLSDGHHLLFTDTQTGHLCLCSDTPTGSVQRLSRKVVFTPPPSCSPGSSPTIYGAVADLSMGLRIAAVYGDNIVLYSVPVDALRYSTAEQEQAIQDPSVPFEELVWVDVMKHPTSNSSALGEAGVDVPRKFERLNMKWVHYLLADGDGRVGSLDTLWPLHISGTKVGKLNEVRALAVQEDRCDGLVVWAFSARGVAKAWKVNNGRRPVEHFHFTADADGAAR
ncbi:uncharacterized protein LTR77_010112 [Saxophila tyrrhenica]|uniref:DUF221-domain-containing protein n=1 Tax=Saxophila tyrrhenica TaxID=1690608 RepID=A0AAV9NWW9_9PEZI|nr:hypothetical protein LTR77_010112 [Saxophila tyrrhenica]